MSATEDDVASLPPRDESAAPPPTGIRMESSSLRFSAMQKVLMPGAWGGSGSSTPSNAGSGLGSPLLSDPPSTAASSSSATSAASDGKEKARRSSVGLLSLPPVASAAPASSSTSDAIREASVAVDAAASAAAAARRPSGVDTTVVSLPALQQRRQKMEVAGAATAAAEDSKRLSLGSGSDERAPAEPVVEVPDWASEKPAWHFDAAALVAQFDTDREDAQLSQDHLLVVAVQAAKSTTLGAQLIAAGIAPLIMRGGHIFRKNAELMRRSCWAITVLAGVGKKEAGVLFNVKPVGGPEVLVNAMTYHSKNVEVVRWACRGISAFVEALTKRVAMKQFVRLGAREMILSVAKIHPGRLYLQKEARAAGKALSGGR